MKKQYVTPMLKVVQFQMERGFVNSAFNRCAEQFIMESIDEEFRAERFNYNDWNAPSTDDDQFKYNDWGTL